MNIEWLISNDASEAIEALVFLLPGFVAVAVFYSLTSHPRPNAFEQIIQALIFTIIVSVIFSIFDTIGIIDSWSKNWLFAASIFVAVLFGLISVYFMNNDTIHRRFRKIRFTKENSYPSEWYSAFSRNSDCYVVLHLNGERRLYGWPTEWPSRPNEGHFLIEEGEWLLSENESEDEVNEQIPITGVTAILVSVSEVEMVEFVKGSEFRALQKVYPIVYFDALFVKSLEQGSVQTRAIYLALAIDMQGKKQMLGLWIAPSEEAISWPDILNELKTRGMEDFFIACVADLKGLPDTIETVFPQARVQLCIMHQVRKSLRYVRREKHKNLVLRYMAYKKRKAVASDFRGIYTAPSKETALTALDAFEKQWGKKYPAIVPLWRKDWERLVPFFDYAPAIRKAVYKTNAIESLNHKLRKIIKERGAFPNDKAVRGQFQIVLRKASKKWKRPVRNWKSACNEFVRLYQDRIPIE